MRVRGEELKAGDVIIVNLPTAVKIVAVEEDGKGTDLQGNLKVDYQSPVSVLNGKPGTIRLGSKSDVERFS